MLPSGIWLPIALGATEQEGDPGGYRPRRALLHVRDGTLSLLGSPNASVVMVEVLIDVGNELDNLN